MNEEVFECSVLKYLELLKSGNDKEAQDFYFSELFCTISEKFTQTSQSILKDQCYDQIISVLGFSPEPSMLLHNLIKPDYHIFICSKETVKSLDIIADHVGVKLSNSEKVIIEDSSTTQIYSEIRRFYLKSNGKKTLIDITGGKKSMSSSASLAGSFLDMDVAYVDSTKYLPEFRKPHPGTEFLVILENPIFELGDLKLNNALELFNSLQFDAVKRIIDGVIKNVKDRTLHTLIKKLAGIYSNWDQFSLPSAKDELYKLIYPSTKSDQYSTCSLLDHLKSSLNTLEQLALSDEFNFSKLVNYFSSSLRMKETGRYDIGVLLLYRTLEGIGQLCLKKYNLDTTKSINPERYQELGIRELKYAEVCKNLYGPNYRYEALPSNISLMNSFILLRVLNDGIIKDDGLLNDIQNQTSLRNKSILAHGNNPLTEKQFHLMETFIRKLLNCYLQINQIQPESIEEHLKQFQFPKLDLKCLMEMTTKK